MLSHIEDFDISTEVPKIEGENTKRLYESYQLLTDLLLKVLEIGRFWTHDELREIGKKFFLEETIDIILINSNIVVQWVLDET